MVVLLLGFGYDRLCQLMTDMQGRGTKRFVHMQKTVKTIIDIDNNVLICKEVWR